MVSVAVGINGDPGAKAKALVAMGVDVLVIDTAHGHSKMVLMAVERVKKLSNRVQIIAGNVATSEFPLAPCSHRPG